MKIAIVGAGNVGQALGAGWRKSGHEITFAVRDTGAEKAKRLAADGFHVMAGGAASGATVIVLAVPWGEIPAVIEALGALTGKIVIDATNPLTADRQLALGFDDSAGETVALLAGDARVVKAFNTTGAENMANAHDFPAKPWMPMAGDDAQAKAVVGKLAEELGFEPVDAGPLKASRYLEPIAMQWIKLAYGGGFGRQFAFSVVRR